MNHFRLCSDLVLVTNAPKEIVEQSITLLKSVDKEYGIDELAGLLKHLGYSATWDNYQDMVVIAF